MHLHTFTAGVTGTPSFRRFRIHDVNPVSGVIKWRVISDPNAPMRVIHGRLKSWLRGMNLKMPHATGALPKCSPRANVLRHAGNRYFYLTDIHNAYPSIRRESLAMMLRYLLPDDTEEAINEFLDRYCFSPKGGLVIGAVASPDLFNLFCAVSIDKELGEIAARGNMVYTRYLDDLTFSSRVPISRRVRREIRAAIARESFSVSHRKSQVLDLVKGPIVINGVGLHKDGSTFLPRKYMRHLRGLIHRAMTRDDVKPAEIHGKMGVFFSTSEPKRRNWVERRLLNLHGEWRMFQSL